MLKLVVTSALTRVNQRVRFTKNGGFSLAQILLGGGGGVNTCAQREKAVEIKIGGPRIRI